jgi:hypothetical protein
MPPSPKQQRIVIGQRFGKLRVVSLRQVRPSAYAAIFECDCSRRIEVRPSRVYRGFLQSCGGFGCRIRHGHGKSHSPEYYSWMGMIQRCENPKSYGYSYYGARGICVCPRWRQSFDAFFADMGLKPSAHHSIERIDNNGNYQPSNCKWATKAEQMDNNRRTRFLEIDGECLPVRQWAVRSGCPGKIIHQRLSRGWDSKAAVFAPLRLSPRQGRTRDAFK